MTDLAERNLAFWQGHEAFEPLVDRGVVDFARFQAGVDESLQLRRGRTTIDRKHPVRHLIVIGNYFFDSLPIDVWQVEDGTLRECRPVMKLAPTATCRDTSDFSILDQLQVNWESRSVPRAGYACSELNHLVEHFRASLRESTFSIPVGGIETLRTIDSWSEHGSLTLIADKGYARECDLEGRTPPTMVRHGCFSFSVNFCALAEWFRERGGAAWLPSRRDGALEVGAFVTDRASWDVDRLHREYAAGVNQFSPGDYHRLTRRDVRDPSSLSLAHCLALLQLGADDPCLLYILRRTLRRQIESASISERQTLTEILIRAADLYYHLDDRDFPFAIGALHQRLGNAGPAAALFRESLRLFGDDPVTRRNLASCQASLAATVWPLPASSELPSTISP